MGNFLFFLLKNIWDLDRNVELFDQNIWNMDRNGWAFARKGLDFVLMYEILTAKFDIEILTVMFEILNHMGWDTWTVIKET